MKKPGRNIQEKRMAVLRQDRVVAAQLDKIIHPSVDPHYAYKTSESSMNTFSNIARDTQRSVSDAKSAKEQLPDLERIQQILVSSILSPKDMVQVNLDYQIEESRVPSQVLGTFLQLIRVHNKTVYKIDALLPEILGDMLMNSGSYTAVVIPESTVDFVINGSVTVSHESMDLIREYTKENTYDYLLGNGVEYKAKDNDTVVKRQKAVDDLKAIFNKKDRDVVEKEAKIEASRIEALSSNADYFELTEVSMGTASGNAIQTSMESMDAIPPKEFVYNPKVISDDFKLSVYDSYEILKRPLLESVFREQRVANALKKSRVRNETSMEALRVSLEASDDVKMPNSLKFKSKEDIRDFEKALYRPRQYRMNQVYSIADPAQLGGKNRSAPITMNPPAISVIPIHNSSSPGDPIGAFILTDSSGHPINPVSNSSYYGVGAGGYMNENLVSQLSLAGSNRYQMTNNPDLDTLQAVYTEMVERDLITRAKRGVLGDNISVGRSEEVMRVMYHRALAGMQTQLVFVPSNLLTYFAFDYNEYGIGRSLLDKSMTLAAVRANLMYANVMAGINNAIGRTRLKINLDPKDKNPQMTVEQILHAHISTRQMGNIVRMGLPGDVVDGITQASIDVEVSGNERYPDTNMQVEDYNSSRRGPDTELEESLKDRHTLSFGLSPEIVEMSRGPELATSVVQNNLMLSKQVQSWQDRFKPQVANHLRKYLINNPSILEDLETILKNNIEKIEADFKDDFIRDATTEDKALRYDYYAMTVWLLNAMQVTLPSPDTTSLENQLNALTAFTELLDIAIEAVVSDEMVAASTGAENQDLDVIKSAYRAYFVRDYLRKNNILPELNLLTTLDDENKPMLDALEKHQEHLKVLSKNINRYLKKLMKDRSKSKKEFDKLQEQIDAELDEESAVEGDITEGEANDAAEVTEDTDAELELPEDEEELTDSEEPAEIKTDDNDEIGDPDSELTE